ncbi:MBL fold metallo-hydrolase [uncultured Aquincola sp.]|uniref:MBL fold metallo-hydrolase n=1 Tax=uncultured Aquincola sp. TaxID=886556 RepID=UPI0032B2B1AE
MSTAAVAAARRRWLRWALAGPATGALLGGLAGCAARVAAPAPSGRDAPPTLPTDGQATVQPVAPGVWMLPGLGGEPDARNLGRVANAGFIAGPQGLLAVDAGTSLLHGRALLRAIGRTSPLPLQAVVITQTKPDVLFGAPAFREAGVPLWMHQDAATLMAARCQMCLDRLNRDVGAAAMAGTTMYRPDELLPGGRQLNVGGGRKVLLLFFGHSSGPGDLAVLDSATGVLFAGGLVEGRRIPNLHDADLAGWQGALQALQRRADAGHIRQVVPGRGPLSGPQAIGETAAYLNALEQQVRSLLAAGVSLAELPARAALPAYAGWDGYPALHRRNAAELYLKLEQEALRSDQGAAVGR